MRQFVAAAMLTAGASLFVACGGTPTTNLATAPTSTSASGSTAVASFPGDGSLIGFAGLTADGASVKSYIESGFQVSTSSGDWRARTTYGNPAPFIQFWAEAGSAVTGEIQVAAAIPTYFKSVDLYSSTTPIPYVITGLKNSAVVFTLSGTLSNTFGAFRTVVNPNLVVIDTLSIVLTNTAAACCRNPMGLDNIVMTDNPAAPAPVFSLSGKVIDSTTGESVSGAKISISGGPDTGTTTTTDASGAYSLTGLSQGGFAVIATATNYLMGSKTIALTSNQTLAFQLARNPSTIPFPSPPPGATVIGFAGLSTNDAAVSSYGESGFTVLATSSGWSATTTYGHPAPFIRFFAEPSTTVTRQVDVTGGGSPFTFASAEFYSSTTRIPYTIIGVRNGVRVFALVDELPNTFGNFRAVVNPHAASPIDLLSIMLTNTAAAGARNPMGLDTIVVVR